MKKLVLLLYVCLGVLSLYAQTPFDSFAPEATRPMLEVEALYPSVEPQDNFAHIDTIPCVAVIDLQRKVLLLVDVCDNTIIGAAPLTEEVKKWLSVDPLVDKNISTSPYMYCGGNPIVLIDPDGEDIYRYDKKTGVMHCAVKTNDNFDQIGKFKFNRKTGQYELVKNKDGSYKTMANKTWTIDRIAKGILRDGMSFKGENAITFINGEGQPSTNDLYDFALIMDNVVGAEVSAWIYEFQYSDASQQMVMFEPIDNNSFSESKNRIIKIDNMIPIIHFHTHGKANQYDATHKSLRDEDFADKCRKHFPNIKLLIINNEGSPIPY